MTPEQTDTAAQNAYRVMCNSLNVVTDDEWSWDRMDERYREAWRNVVNEVATTIVVMTGVSL